MALWFQEDTTPSGRLLGIGFVSTEDFYSRVIRLFTLFSVSSRLTSFRSGGAVAIDKSAKETTMRKILMILVVMAPTLLAQGGANCQRVGGAVLTNFLDQTTTLGTATGDLKGALGVTVLSVSAGPNGTVVFHNHHHWVTEAGDTIFFNDAFATAYPTGIPGLYAVSYTNGVALTGGTGRFVGASGNIASFGAVDLNRQQVILRYEGQVCFAPVTVPASPESH